MTTVFATVTSPIIAQHLQALATLDQSRVPVLRVITSLDGIDPAEVSVLHTYRPPAGVMAALPRLRMISGAGAGVDAIISAPDLPAGVPLVRCVDAQLGTSMAQYVALMVLRHFRMLPHYEQRAREAHWDRLLMPQASAACVGVMGLGEIGRVVVRALSALGLPVVGWSRSGGDCEGAQAVYAGDGGLPAFLARCNYLVCVLPLTPATRGILDADLLAQLPRGAYVINVSRGAMVQQPDLIAALRSGQLSGAALDVFDTEPLPADDPWWREPGVLVTPHISSQPSPLTVAEQLLENIRRLEAGEALLNQVDIARGY